jgi:hypothetical protein
MVDALMVLHQMIAAWHVQLVFKFFPFALHGAARNWWTREMHANQLPVSHIQEAYAKLQAQFTDQLAPLTAKRNLLQLRQGRKRITEHLESFRVLHDQTENLSEGESSRLFLDSLNVKLRLELELKIADRKMLGNPTYRLSELFSLARIIGDVLDGSHKDSRESQ